MKGRLKNSMGGCSPRYMMVWRMTKNDIMTGFLSVELHKKMRMLSKKRGV